MSQRTPPALSMEALSAIGELFSIISGARAIKLAVRRAILLPVDVKLLMSATGSTRALRTAMIMSDGREGIDAEASVAASSRGASLFDDREQWLESGASAGRPLQFGDTDSERESTHSAFCSDPSFLSRLLDDAPKVKKGGKKDPGSEA